MLTQRLKTFLEDHHVPYRMIAHPPAYTAQETAAAAHISGKELVKTLIVKIDGKLAIFVEPANMKLNLKTLAKWTGAKTIELANESEFTEWFPDCEVGAMPPLGELYDMDVYLEPRLAEDERIAFNAGTHTDLVEMAYRDFEKLAKPKKLHMHH